MRKMFTIKFSYLNEIFAAFVQVKQKEGITEYRIRLMNASLNYWLYDNNIFRSVNDQVMEDQECSATKERVQYLRNKIRIALQSRLRDKKNPNSPVQRSQNGCQSGL
ncbi:MAG: hypothetical protein ACTHMC_05960 [Pseudobacter sp.]|uniref:hypothetical protein n=1 Tax=Pseudobacter sp. TaxID=2045420 RepID=UPI003F7DCF2F